MVGRRSIWCSVPTGSRLKMIKILRRFQSSGLPIEQSQVKMLNKTSWVLRWRMQSFATGGLDRHQCRIFFFFFLRIVKTSANILWGCRKNIICIFYNSFQCFDTPFSPLVTRSCMSCPDRIAHEYQVRRNGHSIPAVHRYKSVLQPAVPTIVMR